MLIYDKKNRKMLAARGAGRGFEHYTDSSSFVDNHSSIVDLDSDLAGEFDMDAHEEEVVLHLSGGIVFIMKVPVLFPGGIFVERFLHENTDSKE